MQSSVTSDIWISRKVGDRQRYRLEKRLGAGGMGDVYLAMDTLLGQQVALKLLKDTLVASDDLRKRFEREVAVCAALKSDHIVQVNDYGVTPEGYPFYVMEYLQGQTLGQLLRQQQRLQVERTVGIVKQVCEGLRLAHRGVTLWRDGATSEGVRVIHRDLKPDNIFLVRTYLGELVKLLDFGIAKICAGGKEYTDLTNAFLGTFHYAAPEQLEVEKDIDGRADIYSLGIILYEMLSGTDPFGFGLNIRSVSGVSWALAHTSKPPIPLRSQPGLEHLSSKLEAVVMRCLQKSPEERFATVEELQQALIAAELDVPQQRTFSEPEPQQSIIKSRFSSRKSQVTHPMNGDGLETKEFFFSLSPKRRWACTRFTCDLFLSSNTNTHRSTLLLTGAGALMVMLVATIAYYLLPIQSSKVIPAGNSHPQVQAPETLNHFYLEQAKQLARKSKLKEAVTVASKIPKASSLHSTAQGLIAQWSDSILKLASVQLQAGKIDTAIAIAQTIPATSPVYHKAQTAIVGWKQDWQAAETQFNTAQKALNATQWDLAIAAAHKVPDIAFWQKKTQPMIAEAQSQIAKADTQPTYTPSPQTATRYPVPVKPPVRPVAPIQQPARPVVVQPTRPTPVHPDSGWEDDSPPHKGWEDSPPSSKSQSSDSI